MDIYDHVKLNIIIICIIFMIYKLTCVIVANCSLFEQSVKLQKLFISRTLCKRLHRFGSCLKLLYKENTISLLKFHLFTCF